MHYKKKENLSTSRFQRLVGVKKATFNKMVEIVTEKLSQRPNKRGRPCFLSVEDQLLIMLMYYREYRTFLHIGASFGISETQCWRTVRRIESYLIASKQFHLPGKKTLSGDKVEWEVIVIDVSESPIERPKKNSAPVIPIKRNDIR